MKYTTYVLQNLYGKIYIGQTKDLAKRLELHNSGKVKSSKPFLPWSILFSKDFDTRPMAMELENKLKNLKSTHRVLSYLRNL
jgi:putative endonuclease